MIHSLYGESSPPSFDLHNALWNLYEEWHKTLALYPIPIYMLLYPNGWRASTQGILHEYRERRSDSQLDWSGCVLSEHEQREGERERRARPRQEDVYVNVNKGTHEAFPLTFEDIKGDGERMSHEVTVHFFSFPDHFVVPLGNIFLYSRKFFKLGSTNFREREWDVFAFSEIGSRVGGSREEINTKNPHSLTYFTFTSSNNYFGR